RARTAAQLGISLGSGPTWNVDELSRPEPLSPGERLEHSRVLSFAIGAMGCAYLALYFAHAQDILSALNVNTLNFAFLILGVLLHGTPARLMRAVREATPATGGVLLQFP